MPEMPVISASKPTTIPSVEERVYDRYHLIDLRIDGKDPNSPVVAIATLQKAFTNKDGLVELSPLDLPVYLRVDDVLTEAASDSDLAQVIGGILFYLIKLGTSQGLL